MFRFGNIDLLWLFILIPVFIIIYKLVKIWKKKSINSFGDKNMIMQLIPEYSSIKSGLKFFLFCFAIILLIAGIANPQIGSKLEEVKREGVDIIIALDVSNSMLAEDLSPNRLERAKRAISQLIDKLHSDRIGIIVFGGQAYVQLPVTTDYAAAKLFLNTINTDIIPTQGTAIGAAIDLAMESFDFNNASGKAIIIITDGENHEDDAIASAEKANEKQVTVHTIGMGSSQGVPIPVYKNGKQTDYKKDKDGNTVVTKLNEIMLQQIAASGGGMYIRASNSNAGLNDIYSGLNKLKKAEYGTKVFTDYEDRFQYFIFPALLLLLLELIISERKSKWLGDINLFETTRKQK
jgi:Ca-activated chloride channel homolog